MFRDFSTGDKRKPGVISVSRDSTKNLSNSNGLGNISDRT